MSDCYERDAAILNQACLQGEANPMKQNYLWLKNLWFMESDK